MARKIIPIACFVLAGLISGCQNQSLPDADEIKHGSIEVTRSNEENDAVNMAAPSDKNSTTVIAFYFHRTIRCPGCLDIEANAQRVIENSFAKQIEGEKLIWIPFNLDEPGGDEFEKEFDISGSTLLLAKMTGGNHREFRKLEKVWDFISDPVKFDAYVQNEVKQFLDE